MIKTEFQDCVIQYQQSCDLGFGNPLSKVNMACILLDTPEVQAMKKRRKEALQAARQCLGVFVYIYGPFNPQTLGLFSWDRRACTQLHPVLQSRCLPERPFVFLSAPLSPGKQPDAANVLHLWTNLCNSGRQEFLVSDWPTEKPPSGLTGRNELLTGLSLSLTVHRKGVETTKPQLVITPWSFSTSLCSPLKMPHGELGAITWLTGSCTGFFQEHRSRSGHSRTAPMGETELVWSF